MAAAANFQHLTDWIAWLEQLNPDRIELGLERVQQVWQQLHAGIDSIVISVAGTNGKGSVVAMLELLVLAAGGSVVAYTSPHLLRFNERIRCNGREVADTDLVSAFRVVAAAQAASATRLTYFEFTTLAALWLISQQRPDVAVLEVGLGGRLDAVNIIDADAAVLTSIGMDHVQWLGDNREAIAAEKVAIARAGRLLVCGEPDPPKVIRQQATARSARLLQIGVDFSLDSSTADAIDEDCCRFSASWLPQAMVLPQPLMAGQHQRNNMACVLALLTAPGSPLAQPRWQRAMSCLSSTRVPARQQRLRVQPELIVDVAHNEQAVAALVDNLQRQPVPGRTFIVLAMLADKDVAAVVRCLLPLTEHWFLPQINSQRALPAEQLQQLLLAYAVTTENISCHVAVKPAVSAALQRATKHDRIVVLGSFVTAAALLADWPWHDC